MFGYLILRATGWQGFHEAQGRVMQEWFVAPPGWKKRVNGQISLLVDLTGK
jgi:hypothetical protein